MNAVVAERGVTKREVERTCWNWRDVKVEEEVTKCLMQKQGLEKSEMWTALSKDESSTDSRKWVLLLSLLC